MSLSVANLRWNSSHFCFRKRFVSLFFVPYFKGLGTYPLTVRFRGD